MNIKTTKTPCKTFLGCVVITDQETGTAFRIKSASIDVIFEKEERMAGGRWLIAHNSVVVSIHSHSGITALLPRKRGKRRPPKRKE